MATAASAEQQAIAAINAYIKKHGGGYPAWYVGIAADPRDRLFSAHCVSEKGDAWIYRDCSDDATARRVELAFLNAGCKGSHGGGDRDTRYAYAYKISPTTCE